MRRQRHPTSSAMLLLSEPQPVKYTSAAVQPRVLATVARQRLSSWAFSSPGVYRLLGLAQFSARLLLTVREVRTVGCDLYECRIESHQAVYSRVYQLYALAFHRRQNLKAEQRLVRLAQYVGD